MLFQKNVEYSSRKSASAWRKVAIGTWRSVGDPSVYGIIELRAEAAEIFLSMEARRTKSRLTLTHLIGKCVAETLRLHPELNCMLRFGSIYQRQHVDIFFQVANDPEGSDLSGITIRNAEQKSIAQIAHEMDEKISDIRSHGDQETYRMKHAMGNFPAFTVSWLLALAGFIAYKLNIWSPLFGTPRDTFGSIMLTNVGSLGIQTAFAPLVPYSHCPCVVLVGSVEAMPVVENGAVVPGKILRLCITFDHRIMDGLHASKMARTVKKLFENPAQYFGTNP